MQKLWIVMTIDLTVRIFILFLNLNIFYYFVQLHIIQLRIVPVNPLAIVDYAKLILFQLLQIHGNGHRQQAINVKIYGIFPQSRLDVGSPAYIKESTIFFIATNTQIIKDLFGMLLNNLIKWPTNIVINSTKLIKQEQSQQIYRLIHKFINNKELILKQKMQKTGSYHKNDPIANYNSKDDSKTFPLIPDEIHKVPQNIRRAIKVGKHRKNINVNANANNHQLIINKKDSNGQKNSNELQQNNSKIQPKRQNGLYVRQIFTFMGQSLNDLQSERYEKIEKVDETPTKQTVASRFFRSQAARTRISGDRILYAKKKLVPIKKGLTVEPRSIVSRDKRNFKVTFLNVQKLQLVKVYNDPQKQRLQINNKTSMALTNSFAKSQLVQNFLQSTGLLNQDPNSIVRRSFYNKSPNKIKLKPFVAPFQRYYYRDFIWKCAYSNNVFHQAVENYEQKIKVFIGRGNNSMLLKSLIKRRKGWLYLTDRYDQANFIWTQIKINVIFNNQKCQKAIYSQSKAFCPSLQQEQKKPLNRQQKLNLKILDEHQNEHWKEYFTKFRKAEDNLDETMRKRNKVISNQFNKLSCKQLTKLDVKSLKIHNHLPNNYIISNKKALYYTMSRYYERMGQNVFEYLPLTYHIQNGLEDPQYLKFLNSFYERAKKIRAREKTKDNLFSQIVQNIEPSSPQSPSRVSNQNMWIVKPGQFTNRGNGITVCMSLNQIKAILKKKQRHDNGNYKTYIIQSYIEKPFLYQKRKFDIRHYMMITSINGIIKGYWYELGYIRTTSYQYTTKTGLTSIHLTNDAVQKFLPEYGKYEKGNKISYEEFQKYLEKQYGNKYNFYEQIYPKMKKIATDSIRACSIMIDPEKKGHNFEIFGMDFMIDGDFHPWLIQINNNPCLQLSCPLLGDIIPYMVQNGLKICLDSLIPPPTSFQQRQKKSKFTDNVLETNKFQLVYNSATEQKQIINLFNGKCELDLDYKQLEKDQDQVFDDDGIQLED